MTARSNQGPGQTSAVAEATEATPYTLGFYASHAARARAAAEVILPLVLRSAKVGSIVDVGCGSGSWVAVAQSLGVSDVQGVDGAYVDKAVLEIPADRFSSHDLTRPLDLGRSFDLALCLEVAEHIPATAASTLVDSLTLLAPLVLFSAAVPLQPGTHHINSQWPGYWAALFATRGYDAVDTIRPRVWEDERVAWWYAQNTLLYARRGAVWKDAAVVKWDNDARRTRPLALVHPQNYLSNATLGEYYLARQPLRRLVAALPASVARAAWRWRTRRT